MRINQLTGLKDQNSVSGEAEVCQAFIKKDQIHFLSLSIFVYDDDKNDEYQLSCSFISPVSEEDKSVDSMFTLHNILSGISVTDVITKFLASYGKFGLFENCDLGDQLFISWVDETTSTKAISQIIADVQIENGKYYDRLKNTEFSSTDSISPRLVK